MTRSATAVASQAAATAAPGARHTGIVEVDAVIDAVLAADAEQLRPLIAFQRMACSASQGPFACKPGEAPGTSSDVLPFSECGSSFARSDALQANVAQWFGAGPRTLHGVYRSGSDILVVLTRIDFHGDRTGVMAIMEGGRITRLDFDCGQTAAQMVELAQPEETILSPE